MDEINAQLKACGFNRKSRLFLCYYFKPETLRAVIDAIKGGDADVDPMQSESTQGPR